MIIKNKKILYFISSLFVIVCLYLLIVSEDTQGRIKAFLGVLFFGAGSIIHYILQNNTIGYNVKLIAGIFGCLIFVIVSYSLLPFNHLFDESSKYNPTLSLIIGIVGILFFGFGFFVSLIIMFKKFNRKLK